MTTLPLRPFGPLLLAVLSAPALTAQAGPPQLLRDVHAGAAGSRQPSRMFGVAPSAAYALLDLDDGVHGTSLWRSDGTTAGTTRLRTLLPPGRSGLVGGWLAVGPEVWFTTWDSSAGDRLWLTDGTAAGTVPVLESQVAGVHAIVGVAGAVDGDALIFVQPTATAPWELWRHDGSPAAPTTVHTFPGNQGAPSAVRHLPGRILVSQLGLLYLSDGTAAGTILLSTQAGSAQPLGTAFDGFLIRESLSVGGRQVTELRVAGGHGPTVRFSTTDVRAVGRRDRLFVLLDDRDLRLVDASGGTRQLATFQPATPPQPSRNRFVHALDDRVLLLADDGRGSGRELWASDGTPAGTTMLLDADPGPADFDASQFRRFGDRVLFQGNTPGFGAEPWITDGTATATFRLADAAPGPASSRLVWTVWSPGHDSRDERLFLALDDGIHGHEPWITDGTPTGTRLLADLNPGPADSLVFDHFAAFRSAAVVSGHALFLADDGVHGLEPFAFPAGALADAHGSASCRHEPGFTVAGRPALGTTLPLQADHLRPTGSGLLVGGLPGGSAIVVDGCTVHVDLSAGALTLATITPDAVGRWSSTLRVPNRPTLLGLQIELQPVFADPSALPGFRPGPAWRLSLGR